MSENEKRWEKWGQIVLVIILLCGAFLFGSVFGMYRETKHKAAAHESLTHALEVIDCVNSSDSADDIDYAFDTIMDDIQDALAWMEKRL